MKTKKELKEEYKQKKAQMGVFQIRNTASNKVLIDCSVNIPSCVNRHRAELRFGTHKNRALQEDWNARGEENFTFEVLSELEFKDKEGADYRKELQVLHQMVVQELNITDRDMY